MSNGSPPRLIFLLNRAQRAVQRWIERRPDAWDGISSAQVGLLFLLESRRNAAIGEIAAALEVAPAAVTNLSKRMQDAGFIERMADEHDARLTRVRLTKQGQGACLQSREVLGELNGQLRQGFSDDELAVIARWLDQIGAL